MCLLVHWGLHPRFDFSRLRVAFSGLLAFTFGFSWWFFSGLKKDHGKRLNFFDRKSILKSRSKTFRKCWKNRDFRKFSKNPKFFNSNPIITIFGFFGFSKNFKKILIFPKKSKKIDLNFKIDFRSKIFNLFPWSFFKPLKNHLENPHAKARSPENAMRRRVIVLRCGQASMY